MAISKHSNSSYSMALTTRIILLICTLASLLILSSAHACSNYTFLGNEVYKSCTELPVLQAFLHWNYDPITKEVQIAYRASQTPGGWIAWALNPTGTGMIKAQALVAFRHSNGSMIAYTTPISSYSPSMQPGDLSFPVSQISTEYVNNEMIIYAVLGPVGDQTTFDHVWQAGGSVSSNIPQVHPLSGDNVLSVGELELLSA